MFQAISEAFEASPSAITFDLENTISAWESCKAHYGKSIRPVPLAAHIGVLETDYFERNSRKLSRIANYVCGKYSELPIESLLGKLELKMPQVEYTEGMTNFDKGQVRHTVAGIFVELLIDNAIITVRVDAKRNSNRKHTVVELGGVDEPVDLFEGVCDQPGEMIQEYVGHQRLNADFKWRLRQIGSMPFIISKVCTDELLKHGYKLSAEYNSSSKYEKSTHRHDRHDNKYVEAIAVLRKKSRFYLPMFFCGRGREYYYFAKVFGVRPGGKLWETCNIDRAEPKLLGEAAVRHIKHIIYTFRHGKFSVEHAMKHFSSDDYEYAKSINPLDVPVPDVPYGSNGENARLYRKAEAEFGERIALNKCAAALDMYETGIPCPYLFGKDLTNSGLIMAANCFRSEKMLRGANMWGLKGVADSHMQFGVAHGIEHLPRVEIKDIHTPLLHGSTISTIVKKLHQHVDNPDDFNEESVYQHNIDAYGVEVNNIDIIAQWGQDVVTNHQNILKWKLPDGFPACHKAMMKRVPFSVFAATSRDNSKKFCHEYRVVTTMPLALDADGQCVFGRANTTSLSDKGVDPGMRGLFANLTHSFDGLLLRWIIDALIKEGEVGLFKHDDYMVSPDMFDLVIDTCQEFFEFMQERNLYQEALEQISSNLRKFVPAPKLFQGNASNKVRSSFNFLMA